MQEHHLIVGGGIAGCVSALLRTAAGYAVTILERDSQVAGALPICRETSNVVSEFHSGAEYPFDPQSARDCLDGRIQGERLFPNLIFGGKEYTRIVASRRMPLVSDDVIDYCRKNLALLKDHYATLIGRDSRNAVFGAPGDAFREIDPDTIEVEDAGAAFVTPQRGINPAIVAALLQNALLASGVRFLPSTTVTRISRSPLGFEVKTHDDRSFDADQVLIATAHRGFQLARTLDLTFHIPPMYTALRDLLFVTLKRWQSTRYTILKLEDRFGGMFSPFNSSIAMVYHPPAAHISLATIDPHTGDIDSSIAAGADHGHNEQQRRADWALSACQAFYPELRDASLIKVSSKVALNTSEESRIRRRIEIIKVCEGCQFIALPKWTMAASVALDSTAQALSYSAARGTIPRRMAEDRIADAKDYRIAVSAAWHNDPAVVQDAAAEHAFAMGLPKQLAVPFYV